MLNNLVLNNFPSGHSFSELEGEGHFIMKTCQRSMALSYRVDPFAGKNAPPGSVSLRGEEAYTYLLEVICGLKSQLLGENEIVGQFKTAYKAYVKEEKTNTKLLTIIEKLFKDAKEIRSKYLLGLSQKTYASIARKQMAKQRPESVLILGSGQLAEDLVNQFKKKARVVLCARNRGKAQALAQEHDIETLPWFHLKKVEVFPFIVNSIGFDGTLFDNDFFDNWRDLHRSKLFIDLGSPSILETEYGMDEGVMHLRDIFKEGAIHESHKKQQIKRARLATERIAARRGKLLEAKISKAASQKYNSAQNNKLAYV